MKMAISSDLALRFSILNQTVAMGPVIVFEGCVMRRFVWILLVLILAPSSGCGRRESEQQRLERLVPNAVGTSKVTGNVTVDGEPVKDLWVTLHPKDASVKLRPRGQTDAKGNFKISTYTGGDGAPDGEYDITIAWLTYIKRDSDWGGPDKLKNQYNDPKTTPFHVTIEGEPVELDPFELKLEGVEVKGGSAAPVSPRREK